jgi:hypothetical protein
MDDERIRRHDRYYDSGYQPWYYYFFWAIACIVFWGLVVTVVLFATGVITVQPIHSGETEHFSNTHWPTPAPTSDVSRRLVLHGEKQGVVHHTRHAHPQHQKNNNKNNRKPSDTAKAHKNAKPAWHNNNNNNKGDKARTNDTAK